ncbi:ARID/BRIGHT DNA binding domain-containing protein [Ditylenchus destructor]|uniref:ARID/BRIGHT DNA binding domain-containing protein n=1 Tax=Ditylenchus destructor TaxID=166010 RepID=A0AAD4MYE7_9BILA|nr:ARID/BRIGHT DNA binding domain-containing protein [Ditylenchus destructor]
MQSDDPPFLVVGTEISAKFKGAFCEAKVKKIVKSVKCKVLLKEPPFGNVTVDDTNIKGKLEMNQIVEVTQGKLTHKGAIQSIKDYSSYTVVFNDGDEKVLRRTQLYALSASNSEDELDLHTEPSTSSHLGTRQTSSSSTAANSPTPSRRGLERHVRSASVTPLKGIASTRSATRAIAALKYGENSEISSKSPTPSLQGPAGLLRSSSVLANPSMGNLLTRVNDDSEMSDVGEDVATKASQDELLHKTLAAVNALKAEASPEGRSGKKSTEKSDDKKAKKKKTKDTEDVNPNSNNKEKQKSTKKDEAGTKKEAEDTSKSKASTKKPSHGSSEMGKSQKSMSKSMSTDSTTDRKKKAASHSDASGQTNFTVGEDPKFPPGSVVIINEYVPPRTGGRVQLGLVVAAKEFQDNRVPPQLIAKRQIPVRSFQNGRYHLTQIEQLQMFDPESSKKLPDASTAGLRVAFERANLYFTKRELPQSWDKNVKLSNIKEPSTSKKENDKSKIVKKRPASGNDESSSSDDDEQDEGYSERRDRFVAHFYKFQDESGRSMDRIPILGGKEIDLYRFYDVVQQLGGHKRVTQELRWRNVISKMKWNKHASEGKVDETVKILTPQAVKIAYLRYFEKFEAFMKHLGYSSLNGAGSSSSTARSSRTIRPAYNEKKPTEQKKEKSKIKDHDRVKEDGSKQNLKHHRSSSKDSSVEPPQNKLAKISSTLSASTSVEYKNEADMKAERSPEFRWIPAARDQPTSSTNLPGQTSSEHKFSFEDESKYERKPSKQDEKRQRDAVSSEKDEKASSSSSKSYSKSKDGKKSKTVVLKRESRDSDNAFTSSDEEAVKRLHRRRGSSTKEDRVKSPAGHQAVEEQDVGYSNAHIFTRFYQGQKVHARHHLRFYDARVITVRQPPLPEIAKSLVNAFELGKITHPSSPVLNDLTLQNMGMEIKDALKNMVNATKIFVHYLGWNSRYDEWLMLHKIRVDEKDERSSTQALEKLVPNELPPQLFTAAMDWCHSSDGIPSLAHTHAYSSDQQRPRRLSSSVTGSKTSTSSEPSKGLEKESSSKSTGHSQAHGHHSSKSSTFAYHSPLSSSSVASSKDHHSPLQKYLQANPSSLTVKTGAHGNIIGSEAHSPVKFTIPHLQHGHHASTSSSHQQVQRRSSESEQQESKEQSVSSTASTPKHSHTQQQALPLPFVEFHRGQNLQQSPSPGPVHQQINQPGTYQNTSYMSSAAIGVVGPAHQPTPVMPSGVYSAPPIPAQMAQQQTTSPIVGKSPIHVAPPYKVTIMPPPTSKAYSSQEPKFNLTLPSSVTVHRGLRSPPVPASVALSSSSMAHAQLSSMTPSSSQATVPCSSTLMFPATVPTVAPYSVVMTPAHQIAHSSSMSSKTVGNDSTAPLHISTPKNRGNRSKESPYSSNLLPPPPIPPSFSPLQAGSTALTEPTQVLEVNLKGTGEITEGISLSIMCKELSVCSTTITVASKNKAGEASKAQTEKSGPSKKSASKSSKSTEVLDVSKTQALSVVPGLTARSSAEETMKSPPLTVSSCGAVEDFDEGSSVRLTETPLNEEDECASSTSNDAKSAISSKVFGSPPPRARNLTGKKAAKVHSNELTPTSTKGNQRYSKSPGMSHILAENRLATPRSSRKKSKSPDGGATSGGEDYEEHVSHTDSSHAVRQRVYQRMEAENMFSSYAFLGLPELDDMLNAEENANGKIKIIEDRMQALRDVYQNYRGKLARLERRHKAYVVKRRNQMKANRDSNQSSKSAPKDVNESPVEIKVPAESSVSQIAKCEDIPEAK